MSISQRFRATVAASTATAMMGAIAAAALVGAPAAHAALTPGWLDPSYGINGVGLVTDSASGVSTGNAGLVDDQGRSLLLSPASSGGAYSVSRLTAAGVVDTAFGTAGSTTLPTGETYQALAWGAGGVYIAGIPQTGDGVVVVHLSTSGQLDTGFGTGGVATVAFPAPITLDVGVTQLAGGDIVVSGAGDPGTPGLPIAGYLGALDGTGTLDPAFDPTGATPGILSTSATLPLHLTHDADEALVLTQDGAAGATGVTRYTTAGDADLTVATVTGLHPDGLDVGSNGEYYVSGTKSHSTSTEMVEAMANDGTPDATFGSAGVVLIPISGCSPTASSVAVTATNIYVFGSYPGCNAGQAVVVRLGLDGSINRSFGGGGVLQTYSDQVAGASVQDYLAAGLQPGTDAPLLLMRFATSASAYASGAIRLNTDSTAAAGSFVPLLPARVLDTRNGTGVTTGAVPAGGEITVKLAGRGGLPSAGISAVALNVTATKGTKGGYVTVYPTGITRPIASNLNYAADHSVANLVTTQLGSGSVTLFNGGSGTVQLIADVAGYYLGGKATDAGTYVSLPPKRLLDTRTGHKPTPVAARGTLTLQVSGRGGVKTTAGAAVLNVTVTSQTKSGYVSVYPAGTTRPVASNINYPAGQTTPGLVTVKLSSTGAVTLYNGSSGTVNLVADVEGFYISGTATESGTFVSLAPTRVLDTRVGTGAPKAPIGAEQDLLLNLAGKAGIPSTGASAVVVNGTVTRSKAGGFLTYTSQDTFYSSDYPNSTLNFAAGQTVANLALIDGTHLIVHNASAGTTDALADVSGYFLR